MPSTSPSPALPVLPTGSRPTTAAELHAETVEILSANAVLNLGDQFAAILAQLQRTEACQSRAFTEQSIAVEDCSAERFHDRLKENADSDLPDLAPNIVNDYCDGLAAAIFGVKAMKAFETRAIAAEPNAEWDESTLQTAACDSAYIAFRLAALYFNAPPFSAARMLLLAAADAVVRSGEAA